MKKCGELSPLQRLAAETRGWNLVRLAEASGVPVWKVRAASCGVRNLQPGEAKAIANALGVDLQRLPRFQVTW